MRTLLLAASLLLATACEPPLNGPCIDDDDCPGGACILDGPNDDRECGPAHGCDVDGDCTPEVCATRDGVPRACETAGVEDEACLSINRNGDDEAFTVLDRSCEPGLTCVVDEGDPADPLDVPSGTCG